METSEPVNRAPRLQLVRPKGFFQACFRAYGSASGVQPFVILFLPRTGSNLLASTLDSHPDILCHHEIFNQRLPQCSQSVRSGEIKLGLGTATERDRDPWHFLDRVFSQTGVTPDGERNPVKFIGAKISPYDNFWVVLSVLLNRRIKKIVVRRSNFLAAFVSGQLAMKTGQWAVFKDRQAAAQPSQQVAVDVRRFRAFARKRRIFHAAVRLILAITGQRSIEIDYVTMRDPAVRSRLLGFLGAHDVVQLSERTQKQERGRLADRIANFDELRQRLSGTRYRDLLEGE